LGNFADSGAMLVIQAIQAVWQLATSAAFCVELAFRGIHATDDYHQ